METTRSNALPPEYRKRSPDWIDSDGLSRYRTIWISDVHLGSRGARAESLLAFLRSCQSNHLFLVGDVIDGWALRRNWYWDETHNEVVRRVLKLARKGTRVTYIPGNHDEFARDFLDVSFGEIVLRRDAVHTLLDSRRVLVMHGDEFDGIIGHARWLSKLGAGVYSVILKLNRWFNAIGRAMGLSYWSLAAFLKDKSKKAVQFIADFEGAVVREAHARGVDAVVCGHIHKAELREIEGILYGNSGDWVESCTALVEHLDGRLEIIHWRDPEDADRSGPPGRRRVSQPLTSLAAAATLNNGTRH